VRKRAEREVPKAPEPPVISHVTIYQDSERVVPETETSDELTQEGEIVTEEKAETAATTEKTETVEVEQRYSR
jgi:hypothetical protein